RLDQVTKVKVNLNVHRHPVRADMVEVLEIEVNDGFAWPAVEGRTAASAWMDARVGQQLIEQVAAGIRQVLLRKLGSPGLHSYGHLVFPRQLGRTPPHPLGSRTKHRRHLQGQFRLWRNPFEHSLLFAELVDGVHGQPGGRERAECEGCSVL
ncbi:MAG TPA: hypothetical protein VE888_08450, partial [Streptosporangiaceae bacterium]|nr:hypothetical protein [Streptosporangiaceae bacterium]